MAEKSVGKAVDKNIVFRIIGSGLSAAMSGLGMFNCGIVVIDNKDHLVTDTNPDGKLEIVLGDGSSVPYNPDVHGKLKEFYKDGQPISPESSLEHTHDATNAFKVGVWVRFRLALMRNGLF